MPAISVTAARPNERAEALSLLFARHPASQRAARVEDALAAARHGELSLDGLLAARRNGALVGTVLGVLPARPGGTAFVWPPVVSEEGPPPNAVVDALLQEMGRRIDASGAALGQVLLEPDDPADRSALVRNGFVHLADLLYLQRRLDQPLPDAAADLFEKVRFDPSSNAERFARVLERTYLGTLDCPTLAGKRSGEDALECHRQTGVFDRQRWTLYRAAGEDIGVLLLADHPDEDAWEIVYVGVVPEARGHGNGRELVLDALHQARDAGHSRLLLAVDARNHFARRVYEQLQFEELTVRSAFVRTRR